MMAISIQNESYASSLLYIWGSVSCCVSGIWVSQLLSHCGDRATGDDGGGLCSHQGVLPAPLSALQLRQQRPGPIKAAWLHRHDSMDLIKTKANRTERLSFSNTHTHINIHIEVESDFKCYFTMVQSCRNLMSKCVNVVLTVPTKSLKTTHLKVHLWCNFWCRPNIYILYMKLVLTSIVCVLCIYIIFFLQSYVCLYHATLRLIAGSCTLHAVHLTCFLSDHT